MSTMLDLKRIRENPEEIRAALLKRMDTIDFKELLAWDDSRRSSVQELNELRSVRNRVSGEIPKLKKEGKDASALLSEMKEVSEKIKNLESVVSEHEQKIRNFLEALPNIPADDVVAGGKEHNEVIRVHGEQPSFSFTPKDHVDLVTSLGLIDYERGTKMGGSGFWLYKGDGSLFEWAMINYFIQSHLADNYEFILPPHLLVWECGYTAGQFPKFAEDVFHLKPSDGKDKGQFLLPTAETALINYHRGEILQEENLPRKYFAYTPCYRKEAGSYRTQERGMIRGHQFNKVEIFQYAKPDQSDVAFEEMIGKAERLVRDLGLHYRVSKLAAKDCSASMAKTYDIEVWIPSMNEYKEVCSASNAMDYQARRGNMRFRCKESGKTEFLHTLNASGLATSRLLPAIVEQFQNEDGSVTVPEVLKPWFGKDRLQPV